MLNNKDSATIYTSALSEKELNDHIQVKGVRRIKERMCYDSIWHVYTDLGTIPIKMYDGMSEDYMMEKCKSCKCINDILALAPTAFYYD